MCQSVACRGNEDLGGREGSQRSKWGQDDAPFASRNAEAEVMQGHLRNHICLKLCCVLALQRLC